LALQIEQQIRLARQKLDLVQQNLITQSNIVLRLTHAQTQRQLHSVFKENRLLLSAQNNFVLGGEPPTLAVIPDSSDRAPVYRTRDDFLKAQALAFNWQYKMSLTKPRFAVEGQSFDFQAACSVSLKKENEQWNVVSVEDKSLLRSWSF
jgi:hypothetical protein